MKELGSITIDVLQDDADQYSFVFDEYNDNVSFIVNALEEFLKYC